MKVKLLRRSRIWHEVGEIVEVSPAEYQYLTSLGSAVDAPKKTKRVIETPEENTDATPTKRKK